MDSEGHGRADVLNQLETVPDISLEYFKRYSLPDHIDKIVDILETDGILKAFNNKSGLQWADFPVDPRYSPNAEQETFKCMTTIAAAIPRVAQQVVPGERKPTTVMECRAYPPTVSEGRHKSLVPDGYYRLVQSRSPTYVPDARSMMVVDAPMSAEIDADSMTWNWPVLEEYTCNDHISDENDNITKLVENTIEVIRSDPTRRFMCGMTIENTMTRFWFFSRAIVLVSEAFDFIKDCAFLMHYILSLSFGTEEELGYDLSVTRVAHPVDEDPSLHIIQYDYRIGRDIYRTVQDLNSFRATSLVSRATQVWNVRHLNDPQCPKRALKDVWIPSDARTELEIQQDIFGSIKKNQSGIDKDYQRYFMEILKCTVVWTSNDVADDMLVFVRDLVGIKDGLDFAGPKGGSVRNADPESADNSSLHKGKKHVRVVFSDVGVSLHDVQRHDVIFRALSDALKGLYYFSIGRYVHRDMSSGNILLVNGIARISDREYAKYFLPSGPKNEKTETPIYMAVEVQADRYLFYFRKELCVKYSRLYRYHMRRLNSRNVVRNTKYSTASFRIVLRVAFIELISYSNLISMMSWHAFPEYAPAAHAFHRIWAQLLRLHAEVENQKDFPQHAHFDIVYHRQPDSLVQRDLFEAFETAAKEAYTGGTESPPLRDTSDEPELPHEQPVYREEKGNDGDSAAEQTHVDLEGSERSEPPPASKKQRTGTGKEKVTSQACNTEDGPVQSIHSAGKRKHL
ncbi:uncharacterized protein BT62DRAFT_1077837 [Guyanagaster necrorhizus]|uniref:Fungal-type protein kinase domain-containing protein n=1 Tax=Guyanagaster necrorhizus TaxID=856835 RepID=A0A9P7VQ29_9AGAR|nr:uncharacterized protein BT62DRAFT_1077837 [Guyanagaster necrorhizus MCA 3950]KAG7444522.1 hypothetical protein BT62DRAFT_1077837 [Guyanagaster necrorhizus MCA 3950]